MWLRQLAKACNLIRWSLAFALGALPAARIPVLAAGASPVGLRCEYLEDPSGLDVTHPRLFWRLQAKDEGVQTSRGIMQSAYHILVASSPDHLARDRGDLWDSGKVETGQSLHVEYAGAPLRSRQRCWWKVRVWDRDGNASGWSEPAQWNMGLLSEFDWQAEWITAPTDSQTSLRERIWIWSTAAEQGDRSIMPPGTRWFRRQFHLPLAAQVAKATLSLSADNSFVAYMNGIRVLEGSDWRTLAETSVDGHLTAGKNVVAVAVTNGGDSPNPAGLIGTLAIVLKDGKTTEVPVDTRWVTYDRAMPGWTEIDFNDEDWPAAVEIARFGQGQWGEQTKPRASLPLLRTAFHIEKPVHRAELAISGLGFYEAHLNGECVDDAVLEPGWTNYRKTCLYRVHDVTRRLVQGENVLGVMLGNGMYNVTGGRYTKFLGSFGPPKMIAQLDIEYLDGARERLVSDDGWKAHSGPVVFSCIFGGEDYDARKECDGWDRPGFESSTWQAAVECPGPGGRLSSRSGPPIKVREIFKARRVTQPRADVWVYDLGQNFSGWPVLTVKGPAGGTVRMITGELLDGRGLVSQRSSGSPVWFSYTLKGDDVEVWRPRFSYTGFRYVQVEGAVPAGETAEGEQTPRILGLEGQSLYPDTPVAGSFSCSNNDVNRVHALILAAIKSNFKSVLTDCPHREKLGWLECSHLLAGCFMYNYDGARFYEKIAADMREAQLDSGLVPDIAPEYVVFSGGFRDSPEWGSACVIAPWRSYWMYGDKRILDKQYATMQRYVDYLAGTARRHIVSHGLGDWYDVGPAGPGQSQLTSAGLTATAIYYQDLTILSDVAALLDRQDDARTYGERARVVREAFNAAFFDAEKNQYDRHSQTANAMPLFLGLVPEGREAAVLANLAADIRRNGNRVTAGDVGFYYVVQALLHGGCSAILYDMLCQTEGPGYMYQLRQGATSLTEAWDSNPASSQNHCMLGHIEEWLYSGLLGIRPEAPGFRRVIIRPQMAGDLAWARGHYDSPYGRIATAWKRENHRLVLDVTIPPNTAATVYVPTKDPADVMESGRPAAKSPGVKFLRRDGDDSAVFAIPSGVYRFESPM